MISYIQGEIRGSGAAMAMALPFTLADSNVIASFREVKYGYIPDGGSLCYLSKLPGYIGSYIALTGYNLSCRDLVYLKQLDAIHTSVEQIVQTDLPTIKGFYAKRGNLDPENEPDFTRSHELLPHLDLVNRNSGSMEHTETWHLANEILNDKTNSTTYSRKISETAAPEVNLKYNFYLKVFYDSIFKPYFIDHKDCETNSDLRRGLSIAEYVSLINRCFRFNTIKEIKEALRAEKSDFADHCLEKMKTRSQEAMEVTHRIIKQGKNLDYSGILELEAKAAKNLLLKNPDLHAIHEQDLIKSKKINEYYLSKNKSDEVLNVDKYFEDNSKVDVVKYSLLPAKLYYRTIPESALYFINYKLDASKNLDLGANFDEGKEFFYEQFDIDFNKTNIDFTKLRKIIVDIRSMNSQKDSLYEQLSELNAHKSTVDNYINKIEKEIKLRAYDKPEDLEKLIYEIYDSFHSEFIRTIEEQCSKLADFEKRRFFISLKKYLFISMLEEARLGEQKKLKNKLRRDNEFSKDINVVDSYFKLVLKNLDQIGKDIHITKTEEDNIKAKEKASADAIKEKLETLEIEVVKKNDGILEPMIAMLRVQLEDKIEAELTFNAQVLSLKLELASKLQKLEQQDVDLLEHQLTELRAKSKQYSIMKNGSFKSFESLLPKIAGLKNKLKEENAFIQLIQEIKDNSDDGKLLIKSCNIFIKRNPALSKETKARWNQLYQTKDTDEIVKNVVSKDFQIRQTQEVNEDLNDAELFIKHINLNKDDVVKLFEKFEKGQLLVEIKSKNIEKDTSQFSIEAALKDIDAKFDLRKVTALVKEYQNTVLNSRTIKFNYLLSASNELYSLNKSELEEHNKLSQLYSSFKNLKADDSSHHSNPYSEKLLKSVENYLNFSKTNMKDQVVINSNLYNYDNAKNYFNIPENYEETEIFHLLDNQNKSLSSIINSNECKLLREFLNFDPETHHLFSGKVPLNMVNAALAVFEARVVKVLKLLILCSKHKSKVDKDFQDINNVLQELMSKLTIQHDISNNKYLQGKKYYDIVPADFDNEIKNLQLALSKSPRNRDNFYEIERNAQLESNYIFSDLLLKLNNEFNKTMLEVDSSEIGPSDLQFLIDNKEKIADALQTIVPQPHFDDKYSLMNYVFSYHTGNLRVEYENSFRNSIDKIMDLEFISQIHKLKVDLVKVEAELNKTQDQTFLEKGPAALLQTFHANHPNKLREMINDYIENWDYSDYNYTFDPLIVYEDSNGFYLKPKKGKDYPDTIKGTYDFLANNFLRHTADVDQIEVDLKAEYEAEVGLWKTIHSNLSNYRHWKADVERFIDSHIKERKERLGNHYKNSNTSINKNNKIYVDMLKRVDQMINFETLKQKRIALTEKIKLAEGLAIEHNVNPTISKAYKDMHLTSLKKQSEDLETEIKQAEAKAREIYNRTADFEFKEMHLGNLLQLERFIRPFLNSNTRPNSIYPEQVEEEVLGDDIPHRLATRYKQVKKEVQALESLKIDVERSPREWIDEKLRELIKSYLTYLKNIEQGIDSHNLKFLHEDFNVFDFIKSIESKLIVELNKHKSSLVSNFDEINKHLNNHRDLQVQNKIKKRNETYFRTLDKDQFVLDKAREARVMREFKDTADLDTMTEFENYKSELQRAFVENEISDFKSNVNIKSRVIKEFLTSKYYNASETVKDLKLKFDDLNEVLDNKLFITGACKSFIVIN